MNELWIKVTESKSYTKDEIYKNTKICNIYTKIIDNNKNIVQKGYDYVIIVKKGIVDLTYQDMEKELLKLLSMGD